jgi:ribonuclease R
VVTGLNPRGVFVQIDKYLADGFIKAEDLPGDVTRENLTPMWRIDQRTGALTDLRSGRSFNFGDLVTVKIAAVDLAKRQMDLVIDDAGSRAGGKAKKAILSRKELNIGGGMSHSQGAGFGGATGSQKRSQRSKSRDRNKKQHRRDH